MATVCLRLLVGQQAETQTISRQCANHSPGARASCKCNQVSTNWFQWRSNSAPVRSGESGPLLDSSLRSPTGDDERLSWRHSQGARPRLMQARAQPRASSRPVCILATQMMQVASFHRVGNLAGRPFLAPELPIGQF